MIGTDVGSQYTAIDLGPGEDVINAPTGYDVIDVETRISGDDTEMQIVVLPQNEGGDPISGIIEITGFGKRQYT